MKCSTSNIQLETILSRIKDGTLNLQPDFQRGEVWSVPKQKKLIDTILRKWTIPPIHIVPTDDIDEVLDGQQRLAAIRDFCNGMFSIDGNIQPYDGYINSLNGLKYDELDYKTKNRFLRYEITFVTLMDYEPSEPAELFDRLNQPMKLTSSEQRNAYIGETRNQIKELVDFFVKAGADKDTIGFSNSRLAYDEIVAKFCYAIEIKTLRIKILASDITERYRENERFSDTTVQDCQDILSRFISVVDKYKDTDYKLKMNKATIYSWFVFIRQNRLLDDDEISSVIFSFEIYRDYFKGKLRLLNDYQKQIIRRYENNKDAMPYLENMISTFNQRASMGSTDALSIIYRDIILFLFSKFVTGQMDDTILQEFNNEGNKGVLNALDTIYEKYNWGEVF